MSENIECIRCHRDLTNSPKRSRVQTAYGIACVYCNDRYFRPQNICPVCTKEKHDVYQRGKLVNNPYYQGETTMCQSCFDKMMGTYKTCKLCRFSRLVSAQGVCKACATGETCQCNRCQIAMPIGRGKYCASCTTKRTFEKSIETSVFILNSEQLQDDYREFAQYLIKNYDNIRTLKAFTKYMDFFVACDEQWGYIPPYEPLLAHFGVDGLRHHLRVVRWLEASLRLTINQEFKDLIAEQERIANLLKKLDPVPKIIQEYHDSLQRQVDVGKITIKTMRLALQPAIDMYLINDITGDMLPTQKHFKEYLIKKAGQYNNLLKFVTYLRNSHNLSLNVPRPNKTQVLATKQKSLNARRTACEKKLIKLMKKSQKDKTKHDELQWLRHAMFIFQSKEISAKDTKQLEFVKSDNTGEFGLYRLESIYYWLPIF